ncbi:MAG: DUF5606 domain-containing protein [Bacteroidales bacterium]|nr:DUF5606 domain-containing protein [Bacteroidales bacterium]
MDFTSILVIAGKPDLSELVSQTKGGAVVKNLVTGQKYPVFKNDRISSLGEIRLFTETEEKPLEEVMGALRDHLQHQPTAFDPKKAEGKEMFDLLAQAVPDYDKERVHTSDVKKLFSWYNVLLAAGKLEPEAGEEGKPEEETNQQ